VCLHDTVSSNLYRLRINRSWRIRDPTPFYKQHRIVKSRHSLKISPPFVCSVSRGGATSAHEENRIATNENEEVESISEKVNAAMRRLGIVPPSTQEDDDEDVEDEVNDDVMSTIVEKSETESSSQSSIPSSQEHESDNTSSAESECNDGICPLPSSSMSTSSRINAESNEYQNKSMDEIVRSISRELDVDEAIVMAAIGATMQGNDEMDLHAAKQMILLEKNAIASIPEDSIEVSIKCRNDFSYVLNDGKTKE